MSTPLVRPRLSRLAAAGLTATLASAGLVASAPAAGAVSPSIDYACTADGMNFTLPVVLDTNAPARMTVGQSAQVTMTASAELPASVAKDLASRPATSFDGTWTATIGFGTAPATVSQNIGRTDLKDQTVATKVPFVATSAPFAYTAPNTPGAVEINARGITGSLRLYNGETPVEPPVAITCTAPNGKDPVIDTIAVVATSATTLVLDRSAIDYGQDVTATAKVTTSSGSPDGEVAFSVDGGTAARVRVDKDGVAALALPDAEVGAHSVIATFVPRDAAAYDGSSSAGQPLTVAKVSTRMRVPVTGRTTTTKTRVGVRAKGAYDTVPTGKVRIKLQRIGRTAKTIKVRTLSDTGTATVGFGRLRKGRYQVVVVYRGDANHRYLKKTRTFRVTRG